jgi:pimeloyl-ACP methyl ester carboxylesterase
MGHELLSQALRQLPTPQRLEVHRAPTSVGCTLELHTTGSGESLVLLPPLATLSVAWMAQFLHFSDRYRVWSVHYAGHGGSQPLEAALTLEARADVLVDVLLELGVRPPFHLVGWSLGGCYAQLVAARAGHLLRSLTLISSAAYFGADYKAANEAVVDDLVSRRAGFPAGLLEAAIPYDITATRNPDVINPFWRALRAFDSRAACASLRMPVLVIAGEDDRVVPVAWTRELARLIPGANYHELPRCGHFAPLSAHRQVNALLEQHLLMGRDRRSSATRA